MSTQTCNFRQLRTNRTVCKNPASGLPCSVNASTVAKAPSTGKVGAKVEGIMICPQRPYRSAIRNRLNPTIKLHLRHASTLWAPDKQNPGRSQTSLNNIAVKRVFFPTPPPVEGAPRELPQLYWQAPQVIIPEGANCSNFRNCTISRVDQMKYLAEEVAKMRNSGADLPCNCAPILDYSLTCK